MKKYNELSKKELLQIQGGIAPIIVAGLGYLVKDEWDHSDQIISGFKKGWNGGRRK